MIKRGAGLAGVVLLALPVFAWAGCPKSGCPTRTAPAPRPMMAAPRAPVFRPAAGGPQARPFNGGGFAGGGLQPRPFNAGGFAAGRPGSEMQARPFGSQPNGFASHPQPFGTATARPFGQQNGLARPVSFGQTPVGAGAPAVRRFGEPEPGVAARVGGVPRDFGGARRFGGGGTAFGPARGFRSGLGPPQRIAGGRGYFYGGRRFDAFRVGRYRWPAGYGYRPYEVGYRLPSVFWSPDYFIYNYADYGVDAPPAGLQWVRYGPDMLLIDTSSGQVANVVHGAFQEDDGVQDQLQAEADQMSSDGPPGQPAPLPPQP